MKPLSHIKPKFRFTIRIGILAVFASIFLSLSLPILAIISWRFYTNALVLTDQITAAISTSVVRKVSTELNPAELSGQLSAKLIVSGTLDKNDFNQLIDYTQNALSILPQAQMVYFGG